MWQKILAIVIVVAAVVGLILIIRKQQKQDPCDGACSGCPLAKKCTKDEKNL